MQPLSSFCGPYILVTCCRGGLHIAVAFSNGEITVDRYVSALSKAQSFGSTRHHYVASARARD